MFYCDSCAIKNGWNMTLFKSMGPCEVCNETKACSDLPCKKLTEEPAFPELKKGERNNAFI